jgi:plasmid stability protein
MASVTIRNLDDDVVARLKVRAKTHDRSLEAELRVILGNAARGKSYRDFRALADRIAAMTPDVPQTDSVDGTVVTADRGLWHRVKGSDLEGRVEILANLANRP